MKIAKLPIKTISKKYNIFLGSKILSKFSSILKSEKIKFDKCLVIIDKNVPKKKINILKKSINCKKKVLYFFNACEKNKNLTIVDSIIKILFKYNFGRQDCVVSLGGGITGDVSGFAASIYKRGIKFINLPSTLLAQVDSSIGGKTGINNRFGKNMIGSFYQPDLVISDTSLLKSLPKREIICGYGEILKHALISNSNNFKFININKKNILNLNSPFIEKAILDSCKIKKYVVENDEKEKNYRKVLNLGHTFAHAFEATKGYSSKLNHGEAVILGIESAVKFSNQLSILNKKQLVEVLNHIKSLNLKINVKKFFKRKDIKKIVNFMKLDKNNSKKINLILLKKIGKAEINLNFKIDKINSFLNQLLANKI